MVQQLADGQGVVVKFGFDGAGQREVQVSVSDSIFLLEPMEKTLDVYVPVNLKKQANKQLAALITTIAMAMGFLFSAPTEVVHAFGHIETVTVTIDISDYHINHVGAENGERFTSADGKMTFILYTNGGSPNAPLRLDTDGEWYEGYMPNISKSGGFYSQAAGTSEGWYDLQVNVINSGGGTPTPPPVEQPKPEPTPEPKPEPVEQPKPEPKPEPVQPKPVEQPKPTPPAPKPVETPKPVEQPKPVETPAPVDTTAPEEVAVVVEEVPASDEAAAAADTKKEEEEKKEETPEKTLEGQLAVTTAAGALKGTDDVKEDVAKETEAKESEEPEKEELKEVETEVLSEQEEAGFPWWILLVVLAGGAGVVVYRKRTKGDKQA